ncbi:uncharacterized protein L969DRAFT_17297 [Mixia osmundae IAM 14324]|uniref:Uncharacterized protein n=1 Tax=Mixia osmundae (strain CBS 9802 / IAM 14324 / JCM 22182 / KY 12970) TaxID=764103 RepID=G7E3H4_MIXOS|nr:uncharacterized protein L969DRAFT_17297 [Mixia osmundae IAM 14324]KEI39371.1 hypothetical protein L969DRAFT_17297 [Mixia osmundae IAM 14324]GAA97384.1 hypothetical protein E5Q_04062 [Mixia osmundae IAM 14324]
MSAVLQHVLHPFDLPPALALLPPLFRVLAWASVLPILILAAVDLLGYVAFRIVYQPVGMPRTMFYKAPGGRTSRGKGAQVAVPVPVSADATGRETSGLKKRQSVKKAAPVPLIVASSDSDGNEDPHAALSTSPTDESDSGLSPISTAPRRERQLSMGPNRARAGSIGFDGPMLGFDPLRSPSPELRQLPDEEDDKQFHPS